MKSGTRSSMNKEMSINSMNTYNSNISDDNSEEIDDPYNNVNSIQSGNLEIKMSNIKRMNFNNKKDRMFANSYFRQYYENNRQEFNIYLCKIDLVSKKLPINRSNDEYFEVDYLYI